MLRSIALPLCLLFVVWLFKVDIQQRGGRKIPWLPLVWMFLCGSRWVSSWLNVGAPVSVDAYSDGSPVDRAVFGALIIWGAAWLYRRQLDWGALIRANWLLALYFVFCLSSLLWTEEPFILLKRWIKDLGNPIVALVMLTSASHYEAVGATLRRLSFLLLPMSVVFVRYYPELARGYDHVGNVMYTGVGHQKNDLGLMCLLAGIYYSWKIAVKRHSGKAVDQPDRYDLVLIIMLGYLLYLSNSKTATGCLVVAVVLFLASRIPAFSRKASRVVVTSAVAPIVYLIANSAFGLTDTILALMGRDRTLSLRTDLWEVLRAHEVNSVIGAGFMSFWTGDRMRAIWQYAPGVNQAHNGYFEQYLNLGYLGVVFIVLIAVVALFRVWRQMDREPAAALLRLCLLIVMALYNYTEAAFYGMHNMWVLFLVACIEIPQTESAPGVVQPLTAPVRHNTNGTLKNGSDRVGWRRRPRGGVLSNRVVRRAR